MSTAPGEAVAQRGERRDDDLDPFVDVTCRRSASRRGVRRAQPRGDVAVLRVPHMQVTDREQARLPDGGHPSLVPVTPGPPPAGASETRLPAVTYPW